MRERLLRVRPLAWVLLSFAYAGGIALLSALPAKSFGRPGPFVAWLGNLFHAPLFFGLGACVALALVERDDAAGPRLGGRRALLAVALTLGYAIVDETHQRFVSGRSSDPFDLLTDGAGAAAAAMCVRMLVEGKRVYAHRLLPFVAFAAIAAASAAIATWSGAARAAQG